MGARMNASILDNYRKATDEKRIKIVLDHYSSFMPYVNAYEAGLIRTIKAEREYNRYMSRVGGAPEQERVMTDVSRQRNIKQSVFVSLLQKREELAMELANTTDKGKLIDDKD